MAGLAGLEPTNARVKVWCLTDLATAQYRFSALPVLIQLSEKNGVDNRDRTDDLQCHKLALCRLSYTHHVGAPEETRTPGPLLRRQLLYPAELQAHLLERVMGIEPTQSAWKADVLPLNYTRTTDF